MNASKTGVAIAGLGLTELGRVFGSSQRRLAAQAVRRATADAGLDLSDLDGLLICPGITGGLDVSLAATLGLRDLALLAVVNSFGASAVMAVMTAAQAVAGGVAKAVACVFADTPLQEGVPAGSAFGREAGGAGPGPTLPERHGLAGLAAGCGFRSVNVYYALAAKRHMERYGTTTEQLGAVAVAQRQWAAGNPLAQFREVITLADHQQSRWVAEPLHLLDCSLVSNGAIAVIVTSAQAAEAGPKPPVHLWGWGQGHHGLPMAGDSEFGLVTGAAQAGRTAMGMAGIGPGDVTMGQLYDCYTYTVLVTLEDYGFCAKGEGGPFVADGALGPGGRLPVNTGGGQLSSYYMWGFTPLSEAVIQARGEGGDRQSPDTDVILVSGNGGILSHHGTLIVSPHRKDSARPPGAARGQARPRIRAQAATGSSPDQDGTIDLIASIGIVKADAKSGPFFAGAARGQLMIKRCTACGEWQPPSASSCPACGDDAAGDGDDSELVWAAASGQGTLVSWSVVHSRQGTPVAIAAQVQLDEGPWLSTTLHLPDPATPPDQAATPAQASPAASPVCMTSLADLANLHAGQPLTVEFINPPAGESYPLFRPLGNHG
ncbi:MAG TPA: OB-fold domain-containing protein [Streptosporangiaceae bacterium]|nr:OB-fold domain-containing protein [Streptosporangiaceae bacterium]